MSVPKSKRGKSKVEFEMTYFKLADGLDNLVENYFWAEYDTIQKHKLFIRLRAEAIEAAGGTEMTKGFGGVDYTFSVEQWAAMINAVENYAGQCQKVTEGHRAAVNALATISDVEAYDYTVGYPPKINFDTYFG